MSGFIDGLPALRFFKLDSLASQPVGTREPDPSRNMRTCPRAAGQEPAGYPVLFLYYSSSLGLLIPLYQPAAPLGVSPPHPPW